MPCEDANSKLVEVVTRAVESESLKVGKSLKIGKNGIMGIQLLLDFLKSDSTALAAYYVGAKMSICVSLLKRFCPSSVI